MSFNFSKRSIAIALALTVLLSAGAAYAAVPTVDTSTTDDTSTTSDITDGHVFALDDATDNATLQYKADSNESSVEIVTKVDGQNETVYTNSSPTTVNWNTTDNDGHFNVTIKDAALMDVPSQVNGNKTVTIRITNNTTADNPDVKEITGYVTRGENRSVVMIGDATPENNSDVTTSTDNGTQYFGVTVPTTANDKTDFEFERNVTTNTDEVVVVLANENASEDFDEPLSALDSASRQTFTGALTGPVSVTKVNGDAIRAYNAELPSDLDADVQAVTYEQVGGQPALVYDVSDNDGDTATVSGLSGPSVGLTDYIGAYTLGGFGMLGLLFVFGHIKRKEAT